ncbi:MAG: BrnA antitoxin family protein [Desulfobacterales bacterium]|nr:BrnA antitoxin family protein [Desulfobacterales bacterium]
MKAKYDFSKGKRGAVLPQEGNKVRITIRLDRDIVDWFRSKVEEQGGGNYQSMLNDALRKHIEHEGQPLEEVLRRVVREEIRSSQ